VTRGDGPLTLRRLRLLVALADHGTVTAASRAARVTQPAFSQSLRALERHFGVPMTRRVGRRVVLTEAAQTVVGYARRVTRLVDESEAAVRDLLGLKAGSLAIGASTTPGTYLLPRLMGAFRSRFPAVELHLRIGDTREVEEWVLRGLVDFGVIGQTAEPLGLVLTPIRRDRLVLVAPRRHPLALARQVLPRDLAAHPLIVREPGSSTRETLERALAARGLSLALLFELGSTEAILRAVSAGLGPSVVSELAVAGPALRGVVVRRVAGLELERYLALAQHPDAQPSAAAEEFMRALRSGAP
jgi:DNA-binding transcriptional LysR family regulator